MILSTIFSNRSFIKGCRLGGHGNICISDEAKNRIQITNNIYYWIYYLILSWHFHGYKKISIFFPYVCNAFSNENKY